MNEMENVRALVTAVNGKTGSTLVVTEDGFGGTLLLATENDLRRLAAACGVRVSEVLPTFASVPTDDFGAPVTVAPDYD